MTASASRNSWVGFSSRRNEFGELTGTSLRLLFRRLERLLLATLGQCGVRCLCVPDREVCFWHLADINSDADLVCFWG